MRETFHASDWRSSAIAGSQRRGRLLALVLACCLASAQAATDKYRLVVVADPATTVTVAWNQLSGADARVHYDTVDHGVDTSAYATRQGVDHGTGARGMRNRFVRLRGLTPNTTYYFVVADGEGVSRRLSFQTAPADGAALSFVAGGDSRNNRLPRQNANRLVAKLRPHGVLFGGDMTNRDTDAEWAAWLEDWQLTTAADGHMTAIVPARGNHERPGAVRDLFDVTEGAYYAQTWGAGLARVYTLNSEISVAGDQREWLAAELASVGAGVTWRIAQFHKPMRPHVRSKAEGRAIYDAWAGLFFGHAVQLVLDSDSHAAKVTYPLEPSDAPDATEGFRRNDARGTVFAGEGCWGAPLRSADDAKPWTRAAGSFNHFNLVHVYRDRLELRTVRTDNAADVGANATAGTTDLPAGLDLWAPAGESVVTIGAPVPAEGTIAVAVAAGADDAEESAAGTVATDSPRLELVGGDGTQTVGLRCVGLKIPAGSRITSAAVSFAFDASDDVSSGCDLTFTAEACGDAAAFSSAPGSLSARPRTASSAAWTAPAAAPGRALSPAPSPSSAPASADLSVVIEEVVHRGDWRPGNALAIFIAGVGSRVATAYEANPEGAARLTVSYAPAAPNPVELVGWSARSTPEGVALAWETAHERDASHFVVEASADGAAWRNIARVAAAGTTATATRYETVDLSPALGLNYYRLRQVDADGTTALAGVVTARHRDGPAPAGEAYPNPTAGLVYLRPRAPILSAEVVSPDGRTLAHVPGATVVDLSDYPRGAYVLRVHAADGTSFAYRVHRR